MGISTIHSFYPLLSVAREDIFPTERGPMVPIYGYVLSRQRLADDAIGSATLTIQGLPAGCDIVVLKVGTNEVIEQIDAHPGTSWAYLHSNYIADFVVDIGFIKPGYEVLYIRNLNLPRSDAVLPVALRADRNFI